MKKSPVSVAIIMGSQTDWTTMKPASDTLKDFGVTFEAKVVSAHRSPVAMQNFALAAHEKYQVIIAGAGGAAHLPGMVAALTTLPVIGVPVETRALKGLDSLLSIAQMPKGIPVATVAIGNATNAALLAIRILSLQNPSLLSKLKKFHETQKNISLKSSKNLK
jgi:5-(carboxyamino)imidazole ribonucleotide mutase